MIMYWAIFLSVVIISCLLRTIFSKWVIKLLMKIMKNEANKIYLPPLESPIRLAFVILNIFIASVIIFPLATYIPLFSVILYSLFTINVFWFVFALIKPFFNFVNKTKVMSINQELNEFMTKLLEIIVLSLSILSVMKIWGIDVAAFLAGFGLFGMAVAFAAQDTIKNFFGCIAILTDKVFKTGDWIKTSAVEGMVEKIGFRTTSIRQFDKALVHIPNTKLADTAVVNFSKMTFRRVKWIIGLTYDTPADNLSHIVQRIRDFLQKHPRIESDPKNVTTIINVDKFNDSSIDIFCYFFTKTIKWTDYMNIKEEAVLSIKKIVEEEGSAFAFPTKSIYISPSMGKEFINKEG